MLCGLSGSCLHEVDQRQMPVRGRRPAIRRLPQARGFIVESAQNLEHERSPTPNHRKKGNQQISSYIYVPIFWSPLKVSSGTRGVEAVKSSAVGAGASEYEGHI